MRKIIREHPKEEYFDSLFNDKVAYDEEGLEDMVDNRRGLKPDEEVFNRWANREEEPEDDEIAMQGMVDFEDGRDSEREAWAARNIPRKGGAMTGGEDIEDSYNYDEFDPDMPKRRQMRENYVDELGSMRDMEEEQRELDSLYSDYGEETDYPLDDEWGDDDLDLGDARKSAFMQTDYPLDDEWGEDDLHDPEYEEPDYGDPMGREMTNEMALDRRYDDMEMPKGKHKGMKYRDVRKNHGPYADFMDRNKEFRAHATKWRKENNPDGERAVGSITRDDLINGETGDWKLVVGEHKGKWFSEVPEKYQKWINDEGGAGVFGPDRQSDAMTRKYQNDRMYKPNLNKKKGLQTKDRRQSEYDGIEKIDNNNDDEAYAEAAKIERKKNFMPFPEWIAQKYSGEDRVTISRYSDPVSNRGDYKAWAKVMGVAESSRAKTIMSKKRRR